MRMRLSRSEISVANKMAHGVSTAQAIAELVSLRTGPRQEVCAEAMVCADCGGHLDEDEVDAGRELCVACYCEAQDIRAL